MTIAVPDEKIALRDYLEQDAQVSAVIGTGQRVVLSLNDVKDDRHWLVLQRAGGREDREVPISRPLIYMTAYAHTPWEALRLIAAASQALGLHDPAYNPRIEGPYVTITDVMPDASWTDGMDDNVPGINRRVPFVMQPLRLTVFREVLT